MAFRRAARLDELWSGEKMPVTVEGRKVLLVNVGGRVYAYEDRCAHLGVALSAGCLEGAQLTCAAHEWRYDACTGAGINPRTAKLRAFAVKVEGGEILVDVDAPEAAAGGGGGAGA